MILPSGNRTAKVMSRPHRFGAGGVDLVGADGFDNVGGAGEEFVGDVPGGGEADLILCREAEDAAVAAGGEHLGRGLLRFQTEQQPHPRDRLDPFRVSESGAEEACAPGGDGLEQSASGAGETAAEMPAAEETAEPSAAAEDGGADGKAE